MNKDVTLHHMYQSWWKTTLRMEFVSYHLQKPDILLQNEGPLCLPEKFAHLNSYREAGLHHHSTTTHSIMILREFKNDFKKWLSCNSPRSNEGEESGMTPTQDSGFQVTDEAQTYSNGNWLREELGEEGVSALLEQQVLTVWSMFIKATKLVIFVGNESPLMLDMFFIEYEHSLLLLVIQHIIVTNLKIL